MSRGAASSAAQVAGTIPTSAGPVSALGDAVAAIRAPVPVPDVQAEPFADWAVELTVPALADGASATPIVDVVKGRMLGVVVPLDVGFRIVSGIWLTAVTGDVFDVRLTPEGSAYLDSTSFPAVGQMAFPGDTHFPDVTNDTGGALGAKHITFSFFPYRT